MTVTNPSATLTLNAVDVYSGGVGTSAIYATGGNTLNRLPHPFEGVTIAPSGSLTLPVHVQDFLGKWPVLWESMSTTDLWNQVVQSGLATISFATETGSQDALDSVSPHGILAVV